MEIKREKAITGNRRFSTISFHIINVLFLVFFFHTDKHSSRIKNKKTCTIYTHMKVLSTNVYCGACNQTKIIILYRHTRTIIILTVQSD